MASNKGRINVWLHKEVIASMDIIRGSAESSDINVSRSVVINTILADEIERINKQIEVGDDSWKRKEWR